MADGTTEDAVDWQRETPVVKGSWWADYADWLEARSGGSRPAPIDLGSDTHRPLDPAPGRYVRET